MVFNLYPHQEEALGRLKPGSILFGDVGSGKTFTSLVYYLRNFPGKDLYVITTAMKRDSGDWQHEAEIVGITPAAVDSWNNIDKYVHIKNAFFIFDEQRVVGYGKWSKSFIELSKKNTWILLSGTPGDTWSDYIPVFIANGFYKHKTDFTEQHIEFDRFAKYPKIKSYHNQGKLMRLRQSILVPMKIQRHTTRHRKFVSCNYNKDQYKHISETRWNPYTDSPIETASELTQVYRRLVSQHHDRLWKAKWVMDIHPRVIVFYNYNYELEMLLKLCEEVGKPTAQWNGKAHESIPLTEEWIYLVQYTAGAEGWNCTSTNVMLFYSLNYSYRIIEQAEGRIDRLNTKYTDLEYFYLTSESQIDKAVKKAVQTKKVFNETSFAKGAGKWAN